MSGNGILAVLSVLALEAEIVFYKLLYTIL